MKTTFTSNSLQLAREMPALNPDADGSCLARIRAFLRDAPPGQSKVGEFILETPAEARSMAISRLAAECATSPATVSRFCRALGYVSYRDFQLDLAAAIAQTGAATLDDFVAGSPPEVVAQRVFQINRESLEDTERLLNMGELIEIAGLIANAHRILLLGIGGSALVARDGAQRFMSLGLTAIAVEDPHEQVFATANVTEGDVVLAISHTGQTSHVVEAAGEARQNGAQTVALTNYPAAPLADACEYCIITAFREHRINAAVSSSRIAQMCVIDCLYFMVASWVAESARRLADEAEKRVRRMLRHRPTRQSNS